VDFIPPHSLFHEQQEKRINETYWFAKHIIAPKEFSEEFSSK